MPGEYTIPSFGPSDLLSSDRVGQRSIKVASSPTFSAAGHSGKAFARSLPLTLDAGQVYGVRIQKNSNVAIRFVRAEGLYISVIKGVVTGSILALNSLVSTNGIIATDFAGSIEVYKGEPQGQNVLGDNDELRDSFFPDSSFCIELRNMSGGTAETFLSIGVEQLTDAGVYSILEPNTQLESNTEMSNYNGTN